MPTLTPEQYVAAGAVVGMFILVVAITIVVAVQVAVERRWEAYEGSEEYQYIKTQREIDQIFRDGERRLNEASGEAWRNI